MVATYLFIRKGVHDPKLQQSLIGTELPPEKTWEQTQASNEFRFLREGPDNSWVNHVTAGFVPVLLDVAEKDTFTSVSKLWELVIKQSAVDDIVWVRRCDKAKVESIHKTLL